METKKVIVPTGYMGSGSSAITDLLDGLEDFDVSRSTFEFVFLHCPNGVFDLEDKLLRGNNAVRSDEALHSFYKTMRQLYDKKYWWVGHYNEYIGSGFWDATEEYVRELTEFVPEYYWYYQENTIPGMVPRLFLNKILKHFPNGNKFIKKPLAYAPMWISYVDPETFYNVSKKYIYTIFDIMGKCDKNVVLDQLLLPFNLHRFSNYFDDDVEVFVVERDPRDVFIANKYYWSSTNEPVPYPKEVNEFCRFYKKLRQLEKRTEHPQIHRIHFEDLIYNYSDTVGKVFKILGVKCDTKKTKFDPSRSIYNTQLFLKEQRYEQECMVIANQLKEYLYHFPYEILHKENAVF